MIKSSFLLLLFVTVSIFTNGQEYNFQYITQSEGLSNTFINGIVQDDRGYLFIATGEGLGIYNGQEVKMHHIKDKIVDDYISSCFKDSRGNIWLGHIQGGSSIYYNGKFHHVHVGAGINSQINDIAEDADHRIWFVSQDYGLYFYTEENNKDFFPNISSERLYYELHITEENEFLLGTDKGIEVYSFSSDMDGNHLSKTQNIGGLKEEQMAAILEHNGNTTIALSLNGSAYTINKTSGILKATPLPFDNLTEDIIITEASSARGYLWVNTLQSGLLKCKLNNGTLFIVEKYNKASGLKSNAVNASFIDREGVLWIGTFGEGLASKEDDIFTYYFIDKKFSNPITSLCVNATELFVAQKKEIAQYDKQNVVPIKKYGVENGLPLDEITCMKFNADSTLFVGTTLNGTYFLKKKESIFKKIPLSDDNLAQTISDIEIYGSYIYIATLNGVYRYDLQTQGIKVFNITTGLPHNAIGSLYLSKDQRLFIGTNSAFISEVQNENIINYPIKDGVEVVEVNDITEDGDANIWFSTNGNGVFKLENGKCNYITTDNGLMSNYCNSIRVCSLGNVWISHNEGLSKIIIQDSVIKTYDQYYGLHHRFLRAATDQYLNEIWFGTENGLVLYNSDKDIENKVPPITSIRYVNINDSVYLASENINLKYGVYKFNFGLAGLTLKGSKKVKYKFILEGYDEEWSAMTDKNSIYYTRMSDGVYTFRVKSFNADGTEGNEVSITIVVDAPFWKRWWFYAICGLFLIVTVYAVIKFREQSFVNYQEKLKRDLALRTREVVEQKNKIEEINKDLTDSINYAQRIQGSILPTEKYLKELFPKSFVFFRPRDIVSGDFYWCGEMNGKQVMVCADCTGHGVPGGFMSMISHILLREALTEEALENPALILQQINSKIVEVLKQTEDFESNRDGLDIAILVFDRKRMEVKFAGAMRPLFIYRDGSQHIVKGDRFSLGGLSKKKVFETKLVEVREEDKLYIFTDGIADQFGGPRRSKMKLKIFQEYLDQVSQIPMAEQYDALSSFFYDWKGEMPQMDDVLVIGIEI